MPVPEAILEAKLAITVESSLERRPNRCDEGRRIPWEVVLREIEGLTPYRLWSPMSIGDQDGVSCSNTMRRHNTPTLKTNVRNLNEYISGFSDGEGCFSVSFSKRDKFLIGWETKPSFCVAQNHDRAEVLFLMHKKFGCGFMRRDAKDRTLKYEVRSLNDLLTKVIPHFENYPLRSGKSKDFKLFKQVCLLMDKGRHTTLNGLKEITRLAFKMNPSGMRKYKRDEILARARYQMKI